MDRRACARTAWATSSTSCRTTWASRSRRTRGGRTSSRTAPARGMPRSSTSTGIRSSRSSKTRCCCRSWATAYGAVLERQEITLRYDEGAFRASLLRHDAADRARHLRSNPRAPTSSPLLAALGEREHRRRRVPQHPHRDPAPARPRAQTSAQLAERDREKEVIKRRLAALTRESRDRPRSTSTRAVVLVQRRGTATRAASIALDELLCVRRPTGWRTGASRPRRSTTGASSTSTSWRRSGWRTRRSSSACTPSRSTCSPRPARRLPDRSRRRPVRSGRLPRAAAGARARGAARRCSRANGRSTSWSKRSSGADEPLPGLAGRRDDRLRLPGEGERPLRRRPQRAGDERRLRALHAAASAVPRDRLPRQAARPAGQHGERAERAGPPAEPLLGAQPPLPRLHAEQPDAGDARDHRRASRSTAPT